jgi:hypothetical protein
MRTKILRNTFINVGAFFALAQLLTAGTNDSVLNFSRTPFLRPQPTIITFDAPGAGTGPGQGTLVAGINPTGVIVGGYPDANNVEHGYLRASDGAFTTYEVPGGGTGPFQGTSPNCINPAGATAGTWEDPSNVGHAYVRAPDGAITSFDAPGAVPGHSAPYRLASTRRG